MKTLLRTYLLSPTAIRHLRDHKKWSLEQFGHAATKKYFQDIDKGFQYIADNYERLPGRSELTVDSGLSIYPIREHYIIYVPFSNGIHVVSVAAQSQDIPSLLNKNASLFQRELAAIERD